MSKTSMTCYLSQFDESEIDNVLSGWQSRYPKSGVCVLLPEAELANVVRLQALCEQRRITLVGGIFPSLIWDGQFQDKGVLLLCFEEMPHYALYADLPSDAEGAQRTADIISADVRANLGKDRDVTLFMLFDAMVPNISTLLDDLYLQLANRVHYAGANAGSETFQPMPCLFDGQRLIQRGVLVMLLERHRGAILEHGYHAPEKTVYATSTMGNCISQIDWRPAFEVYRELVRAQSGVEITAQNFYEHAVHFPFGIVRANHHVVVRIPVMLAEDGSLFCVGEVPANSVLTLLEAPAVDSRETLKVLTDGLAALGGDPAGAELLLFYCAGRRMHMGLEAATAELQAFSRGTKAAQVSGALSLGEIGGSTIHGYPLFHNATLVASSWHKG